jgi:hypothetical protein
MSGCSAHSAKDVGSPSGGSEQQFQQAVTTSFAELAIAVQSHFASGLLGMYRTRLFRYTFVQAAIA